MLTRADALDLLAYDAWANRQMSELFERARPADANVARVWAHVGATLELWHARQAGGDYSKIAVWPPWDLRESSRHALDADRRWTASASEWGEPDLARIVRFANTRGEPCADRLDDIVRHVANHGTHHRAQIAMRLREIGIEPLNLDYIVYCRKQRDAR
jgi:uncharacterized damage-inducible protein DinB